MFGFFCSIYLVIVICCIFLFERKLVEKGERLSPANALSEAIWVSFDLRNWVQVIPFIIFAYMYQPNIPIIYRELKQASYNRMLKIVSIGTSLVIGVYIIAATFGYLTWAGS